MRASQPLEMLGPEHPGPSDEELARAAVSGDMRAVEELFRRYEAPLVRYLQRLVRDDQAGEDLFQDAFFRAWVNLSAYDPRRAFRAWLYRIATNIGLDWLRRQSRALPPADPPDDIPVVTVVAERDLSHRVAEAIAELSLDHRTVFILRHYQSLGYTEIAQIAGSPEGTVRSRRHHALRILREKLRYLMEEEQAL